MPVLDYANFLKTFTLWLAGQASLQAVSTPRALWAHAADETGGAAADPYTVLRIFGGAVPWVPTSSFSIQSKTVARATGVAAAMGQAAAVFAKLLDATGRPLRMTTITVGGTSLRINKVDLNQPPSLVSRDERGRAEVVFNFEVEIVPL